MSVQNAVTLAPVWLVNCPNVRFADPRSLGGKQLNFDFRIPERYRRNQDSSDFWITQPAGPQLQVNFSIFDLKSFTMSSFN